MDEHIEEIPTIPEIIDRTVSTNKKKEIIQEEIQNIFEENLYENCNNAIKPIEINLKYLKVNSILLIFFIIIILTLEFIFKKSIDNKYYNIILLILILIDAYFLTYIIYKIILLYFPQDNIYYFLLGDNMILIRITLYLISSLIILLIFFKSPNNKGFTFIGSNKQITGLINSIITSLLSISLILLLKEFFISSINYRNQNHYYKHRIELNNKYISLINKLNSILNEEIYPNLKKWSKKIFNKISNENNIIKIENLEEYFSPFISRNIFRLFDTNHDNSIEETEFISRYLSIFTEKKNLSFALTQNSSGLYKLNILCTICTIPIMSLLIFMCFGAMENYSSSLGVFAGGLLSLSFAFSNSISELVDCIILIYFVRPFDIGDMIGFNNKKYIVKKIGLLYSDLIEDSTLNIVSNKFLKQQKIENYRTANFITEVFIKYYTYESIIEKFDKISFEISKFLEINFNSFTPIFHIYRFDIVKDVLKLNIEINIRCKFQELRNTAKRRDSFELWFTELANQLELKQR